jgi:hypothetical protein
VASTRAGRQALIERLLIEDAQRSDRDIARTVGVHHSTAGAHRARLEAAGRISREHRRPPVGGALHPGHNVVPPPDGNNRALKSGHHSERRIGPIAERNLVRRSGAVAAGGRGTAVALCQAPGSL